MFEKEIKAYALKNAIEFGKADSGRILTKLFTHGLKKEEIKQIMPEINQIVSEVNSTPQADREEEFEEYRGFVIEHEEKEKVLPELLNAVEGKVVTRLPPEPSKHLHVGHALSFLLNYIYAKRYGGKCLLRFEDTNPEKVSQEFVDADLEDIQNYLKIKPDSIRYVSDDMPLLYKHAQTLIEKGNAYMCFCAQEKMQEFRHEGKECECRNQSVSENLTLWESFLKGKYEDGKATLRFKGNMKDLNHVMRDSVLFRSLSLPHYRQGNKYKVWPMYDFYNPIEDGIMGITHILRSNEFDQRVPLQDAIKDILGLPKQTIMQYGRFNVIEDSSQAKASGREIRALVESGKYLGWDDPRLVTLKALKRRGIGVDVLNELVNQLGLSKHEVNIDFDMLASINRKIIDLKAERYYFVPEPVELEIKGAPIIKEISVPLHPDNSEKTRNITIGKSKINISETDLAENKGKEVRLLHLYNIRLLKVKEAEYLATENRSVPKLTWVASQSSTAARVLMPDATWVEGLAEENIENLKIGDVIQFERFGFVRFDTINKGAYEFWFSHK